MEFIEVEAEEESGEEDDVLEEDDVISSNSTLIDDSTPAVEGQADLDAKKRKKGWMFS